MVLEYESDLKNGFVDEQGILPKLHTCVSLGFNTAFRGPTGCGKTYLVQELAKQYNKKLSILNMTVDTEIEEIKGRMVPIYDESAKELAFKWVNGILVESMLKGDWLVIEEANFMNEELASVFYSVMDHRRSIQLDEHKNELIKAHEEFRLFLTMNWGYKGTTMPNDAIRNRVDAWFDLGYLSPEGESNLLVERTTLENKQGVDKSIALKMVKLANQFRQRDPSENLPDVSTRILLRWASMVREGIPPEDAAEFNIIPLLKYNEIEKAKIREIVRTTFERPEAIKSIKRGNPLESIKLGEGSVCKVGDLVEFQADDGKLMKSKIMGIVEDIKKPSNPEGVKVLLEEAWMPSHKLHKVNI